MRLRKDSDAPDTNALASASAGSTSPTDIEAIASASSITSHDTNVNDSPIGLSDPQYVGQRRMMLDYVNRLRATGAYLDLDIPVIAVVGAQSAGKSSLIEAISGITLPRALGTCTRCPTECQLSRSNEPWRCVVSLHSVTDADGVQLAQAERIKFGDPIFDKTLVTDRIRRAQCAILNPETDSDFFLVAHPDDLEERHLSFSSNSVCLEISGKDVEDLSFVDLPGLIVGGERREAELVEQLVEGYISKDSCIILLTIACETDFENQSAHRLAADCDPSGTRTIGVLTKPDRIPPGEEAIWINKIQRGGKDGGIEYYSVKNPESQDIRNGITYEQARDSEAKFFSTRAPWSNLEWLYKRRLGTDKLTRRLGQVLTDLISRRLPELQGEVDRLLEQAEHDISRLPIPPTSEPMEEMFRLVDLFVGSLQRLVDGTPEKDGLIQSLRKSREVFKGDIRQTAPDFRPFERPKNGSAMPLLPPPCFLSNEEPESVSQPPDATRAMFVEDVMKSAESAVTRELPNIFPYTVTKAYIRTFVEVWNRPSKQLFESSKRELNARIRLLIEDHFSQYTHGHLKQRITGILQEHLEKCTDAASQHIDFLVEQELEPFTMNDHLYLEYRSNFLAHYKGAWLREKSNFMKNLENRDDKNIKEALKETITGLTKLGLESANAPSLAKLLPSDPMEPAIGIMADVQAYFQVAYKRFVDVVPMCIDRTLLRGVTVGLEKALRTRLAINGPGAYERCKLFLSEPEDIVERRSELQNRRQRLLAVRKELIETFV